METVRSPMARLGSFRKAKAEQCGFPSRTARCSAGGLPSDTSASTTFAVGSAEAASLIYASAVTVAATSATAATGPTVFGDFLGGSFVARAPHCGSRDGFIRCRGGRVFGRPSGPQDRPPPPKLEIPFGYAFDKRGASLPDSADLK